MSSATMSDTREFKVDELIFPPGTERKFVARPVVGKLDLAKFDDEEMLKNLVHICSDSILDSLRRVYGEEAVQRALRGS